MVDLIHFFQYQVEKPAMFGAFHLVCIAIILIATVAVSAAFKNCSDKIFRRIIFVCWLVCLCLEIIKQPVKSLQWGDEPYFRYSFYDFPFHLCSTVYYIAPALFLMKREKCPAVYDALSWFCGIFVLMGGMTVVLYNDLVMSETLFINIQSMVHHGIQILLGVFIVVRNRERLNIFSYLKALAVLGVYTALAVAVNSLLTPVADGIDMFYVNPFEVSVLPVINEIHRNAGFIPYLAVYLSIVALFGFAVYAVEALIAGKFRRGCLSGAGKKPVEEKEEDEDEKE